MKNIIISYAWQGIALVEFLVICFLLFKNRRKQKDVLKDALNKNKKNKIDMDSLMVDMHHSQELYKKLSRKFHPDRFIGTSLMDEAEQIFKKIQENRTNYASLLEIQIEAEQTLKN